jgi:hypothetical protein
MSSARESVSPAAMITVPSIRRRLAAVAACAALVCAMCLPLAGCRQGASGSAAPGTDEKDKDRAAPAAEGVTLKPEEIEKAGIVTVPAVATSHAPETTGYAVVITREAIAQAVADLTTAAAAERQSRSVLARGRGLAGTPGAMPVEAQEAAERQATVDHAARVLVEQRVSATYGRNAPWKDNYHSPQLASLASGERKLARVTFPLGALGATTPTQLRLSHLGESQGKSVESLAVWSAPADASIPGRSFFAVLKGREAGEGERLVAHAPVGAPQAGVVVPFSAVVLSGGKYWCYVEEHPGSFVRTEIDTSAPTDSGYFIKAGIAAGAKIVTAGAGLLLAREMNPSTEAD